MNRMRRLLLALLFMSACNPVTVYPLDDEDAGDASSDSAATDAGSDATGGSDDG